MPVVEPRRLKVSVLIPCFNEARHIGACLDNLMDDSHPHELLEILVLDGGSTDNTRTIIQGYHKKYSFIRLVENPRRLKPVALNIGIRESEGDIVIRVDAHARYPKNYITNLVRGLIQHEADNIGGLRLTDKGDTAKSHAISMGVSHPFASGAAPWRTQATSLTEVHTVFCGCYKRSVFSTIGYFNENLIRTQDKEFNLRLKAKGGKILLDPTIKITYFPRVTLGAHFKWTAEGASWVFRSPLYTDIRLIGKGHFVPLLFVLYLLALPFLSILSWFFMAPLLAYIVLNLYFSGKEALDSGKPSLAVWAFAVFFLTHVGYGYGAIQGLIAYLTGQRMSGKRSKTLQSK